MYRLIFVLCCGCASLAAAGGPGDPSRAFEERRDELRQRRRDLEETLTELDTAEEACVERLAELGVNT